MDIQKAKLLLDKTNYLFSKITKDNSISPIEKKLMMDYLSQLYEEFIDGPSDSQKGETVKTTSHQPMNTAPIVQRQPVVQAPPPQPIVQQPVYQQPVVQQPVVQQPVVQQPIIQQQPIQHQQVVQPAPRYVIPQPVQQPVVQAATPPPPPAPKPEKKAEEFKITSSSNEDYDFLFEVEEGKDLSDKLSTVPLRDLNKAFSINDRFQMIKELFGGSEIIFKDTIGRLNEFRNLKDARTFLEKDIIGKYNWTSKNKQRKAQSFIQTIKRRYL